MGACVGLPACLPRTGFAGRREPTYALLRELTSRHLATIAFKGLDPFLGRPVDLDPAAVQAKLAHGCRGGYCHERNALFHDMLAALGFAVTR